MVVYFSTSAPLANEVILFLKLHAVTLHLSVHYSFSPFLANKFAVWIVGSMSNT